MSHGADTVLTFYACHLLCIYNKVNIKISNRHRLFNVNFSKIMSVHAVILKPKKSSAWQRHLSHSNSTLIISMLEKLVTSDQLSLDFLTVAKLTNQTSHVSQY